MGPHGPVRRPGNPPGIDDASEPWRVALQAGPGTLPGRADEAQRWQARRAETGLAAPVGPPTRRSRRLGRQRKASQGTLAALAAAPPVSLSETTDRPFQLSYPTPAPGPRDADSGRGRPCLARATRLDALSGRVARGRRDSTGGAAPRFSGAPSTFALSGGARRRSLPECPTATAVAGAALNDHRASRIEDDASVFVTILILGIDHRVNVLGFAGIEPSPTWDIVSTSCCHCSTLPRLSCDLTATRIVQAGVADDQSGAKAFPSSLTSSPPIVHHRHCVGR